VRLRTDISAHGKSGKKTATVNPLDPKNGILSQARADQEGECFNLSRAPWCRRATRPLDGLLLRRRCSRPDKQQTIAKNLLLNFTQRLHQQPLAAVTLFAVESDVAGFLYLVRSQDSSRVSGRPSTLLGIKVTGASYHLRTLQIRKGKHRPEGDWHNRGAVSADF